MGKGDFEYGDKDEVVVRGSSCPMPHGREPARPVRSGCVQNWRRALSERLTIWGHGRVYPNSSAGLHVGHCPRPARFRPPFPHTRPPNVAETPVVKAIICSPASRPRCCHRNDTRRLVPLHLQLPKMVRSLPSAVLLFKLSAEPCHFRHAV